jgi:hypothetical protein
MGAARLIHDNHLKGRHVAETIITQPAKSAMTLKMHGKAEGSGEK